MRYALTRQQRALLEFMRNYTIETGAAPSFDEMKDAMNLKSKSGIHRLVCGLEERGFVTRLRNRARAIQVVSEAQLPNEDLRVKLLRDLAAYPDNHSFPVHGLRQWISERLR